MATTDARPVAKKNVAYRHYFEIRKTDNTVITTWTGMDTEVSKDAGNYADATNEATEVQTSGTGYIDLTATEMDADCVLVKVVVTNTDAVPYIAALYPEEAGDIRVDVTQVSGDSTAADNLESACDNYSATRGLAGTALPAAAADAAGGLPISDAGGLDLDTILDVAISTRISSLATGTAQAGAASSIQLAAAEGFADDELNGCTIHLTGGTGAGQSRLVTDYTSSSDTAAITPDWTTNPDATSTYEVIGGGHVNVASINLLAASAVRLAKSAGQIVPGTVEDTTTTPSTTVFAASDITEATADHYRGRVILFTSGALSGQACEITDYALVGGEGKFTTSTLTESPADGDEFIIV